MTSVSHEGETIDQRFHVVWESMGFWKITGLQCVCVCVCVCVYSLDYSFSLFSKDVGVTFLPYFTKVIKPK